MVSGRTIRSPERSAAASLPGCATRTGGAMPRPRTTIGATSAAFAASLSKATCASNETAASGVNATGTSRALPAGSPLPSGAGANPGANSVASLRAAVTCRSSVPIEASDIVRTRLWPTTTSPKSRTGGVTPSPTASSTCTDNGSVTDGRAGSSLVKTIAA
jgi:hypothetical protein